MGATTAQLCHIIAALDPRPHLQRRLLVCRDCFELRLQLLQPLLGRIHLLLRHVLALQRALAVGLQLLQLAAQRAQLLLVLGPGAA